MVEKNLEEALLKGACREGWMTRRDLKRIFAASRELRGLGVNRSLLGIARDHELLTGEQITELRKRLAAHPESEDPSDASGGSGDESVSIMICGSAPEGATMTISAGRAAGAARGPDEAAEGTFTIRSVALDASLPALDDLLGRHIGGCEIEELIGRGAMGLVFKARHMALKRVVAVKVLNPAYFNDEEHVAHFFREAQAAAATDHENIVAIHDMGMEGDLYYIVMQYIEGGSIDGLIRERGKIAPLEAARIGLETARGLSVAHAQGIVHRDIKPANLLLAGEGKVRIADFGLALEQKNALTGETRTIMGTPAYMSPEQIAGRAVDHRADLYSLGVTLYYLVTGRKPFTGRDARVVIQKHLTETPVPLHRLDPTLPDALVRIIDRLLAKNPDNRYARAEDLIVDLEEFLHGGEPRVVHAMQDFLARMEEVSGGGGESRALSGRPAWAVLAGLAGALIGILFSIGLPSAPAPSGGTAADAPRSEGARRFAAAELFVRRFPEDIAGARERLKAVAEESPWPWSLRARQLLDEREKLHAEEAVRRANPILLEASKRTAVPAEALHILEEIRPEWMVDSVAEWAAGVRQRCGEKLLATRNLVFVPGGEFRPGPGGEAVGVESFLMDATEVSCRQYAEFLAATGRFAPADWPDGRIPPNREDLPVVGVSRDDAAAYAAFRGGRLPTSLEWERAARGADDRAWPWGDVFDPARAVARGSAGLEPVRSRPEGASPVGCLHMAGNAYEWTDTPAEVAGETRAYLVRGGSWRSHPEHVRTTEAWPLPADDRDPSNAVGFRCAHDLR